MNPISRNDILLLGITSGVMGSLTGGMLLGIGLGLVMLGANWGWAIMLPGAPIAAIPGWLLSRKLTMRMPK